MDLMEFLFKIMETTDLETEKKQHKEFEKLFQLRKQHLKAICQNKGYSEDDPVPEREDREAGQMYRFYDFQSLACM